MRTVIEPEQKALEINLNDKIYGTFAEIGAGQEVARHFFQAGAAAGTIAKTMSAYDKIYSDEIYGVEPSGRYVCESRLYKMLDHEYGLLVERLENERKGTTFFVFSDTIAALNYHRTIKGDGWLGLRFQLHPNHEPNDIVLHAKMLDNDTLLQQQAIGILGVNLIYACYKYNHDAEMMIESLMDNLRGRIKVDMLRITGPEFPNLDNRWISLMLIKHKLSDVAMFGPDGRNIHASEFLYKKNVLVVRGSFRPLTLVNQDMIRSSWEQFNKEEEVDPEKSFMLTEITLNNLCSDGVLDERDFLDRAEILCAMGYTVAISNCEEHQKLVDYLADYKVNKIGMVKGAKEILKLINNKFKENKDGRLLAAFGEMFRSNVIMYVYPILQEGEADVMCCNNLPIADGVKFLFQHLLDNNQIIDLKNYDKDQMHIFSKRVLKMINADEGDWEKMVPEKVAKAIKEKYLFGFPSEKLEFEY